MRGTRVNEHYEHLSSDLDTNLQRSFVSDSRNRVRRDQRLFRILLRLYCWYLINLIKHFQVKEFLALVSPTVGFVTVETPTFLAALKDLRWRQLLERVWSSWSRCLCCWGRSRHAGTWRRPVLTCSRGDGGEHSGALFVRPRHRHCTLKILRRLEFDVDANGFREAAREEVNLLLRCQVTHVRHLGEERLLEVCNRAPEWQTCELCEVVDAQGWTESLAAEILEERPGDVAGVALEHEEPLLRHTSHVERGQPYFVGVARVLCSEKLLTSVEPPKGIFLAIKHRK